MADFQTILVLTGMGIAPYSARGVTQTLEPIAAATSLRRTVNGDLADLSVAALQKFKSTISCTDGQSPAVDGIMPGAVLTVDCVCELSYPTGGTASRTVISGTSRTEEGFVFYRPRLTMRVTSWRLDVDEWDASVGWTLGLEEV